MAYRGVIAGLGNPGPQYAGNRHNFGFLVLEHILALAEARPSLRAEKLKCPGELALWKVRIQRAGCLLLKPLAYMNASGQAVARVLGRHGLTPAELLVLHDEIDLPLGRMKLKQGGGTNGHHGLDSIVEHLGTGEFYRLRLGIGRPPPGVDGGDWVLSDFEAAERPLVRKVVEAAFAGIGLFYGRGPAAAVQHLHSFVPEPQA